MIWVITFGAESYKLEIPYQFNAAGQFSEGLAAVQDENGKCRYIDITGKIIAPYQFIRASDFSEGLAAVKDENGKCGYIDITGEIVIPCQFKDARAFSNGLAPVYGDENGWGYIDSTGKVVIPYQFINANPFSDGLALVLVKEQNGEWRYIDTSGNIYSFGFAGIFNEGLVPVKDNYNKWGYMDTNGKNVIPYKFYDAYDFSNGLAAVKDENDKYRYINTSGELVIPYQFESARSFSNGLAVVMNKDSKNGYISSPYTKVELVTPDKPVGITTQPTVIFKGSPLSMQSDVLVLNGRTYYPFRNLLESVGATVEWDNATKMATGKLNGKTVSFIVDKEDYTVNGQTVRMDNAKCLVSYGKTYVPIRYALEGLGFSVDWDSATNNITVY